MARASKTTSKTPAAKDLTVKKTGTSIANVEAEMSQAAQDLRSQIGQSSSNRLKVTPQGDFTLPDGMSLGNEIQIVVVDFISRNSFYSGVYNPNNPSPPDCYAMGRIIMDMAPEPDSPSIQSDKCAICPMNQFGSGANGTSKACKNTRELAVLVIDPENPEAHNDPAAPIYTMSLPPTAIKSFDGAVGYVSRTLGGLPIKAIITVTAKPVGTYALISFVEPVPNPDYALHWGRREEVQEALFRKPDFAAAAARPAQGGGRNRNAAPARRPAARR